MTALPAPAVLAPNLEQAQRYLEILDPGETRFSFATFDDVRGPDGKPRGDRLARTFHGTLAEHADELARLNARGAGVFVTINRTNLAGRTAADITDIRAAWHDEDRANVTPILPADMPPHVIVETSPGRTQRLWRAEGLKPDQHRAVMRAMVERHGSDRAATDIARVLRLPGFFHMKRAPHMVRIVAIDPFADWGAYSAQQVLAAFPPIPEAPRAPVAAPVDFDADTIRDALGFIAAEQRDTWLTIGMALHNASGGSEEGYDLWFEWSEQSDKFDEADQRHKWDGFKPAGNGKAVTLGSLFKLARDGGWKGSAHERLSPFAPVPDDLSVAPEPSATPAWERLFPTAERWSGAEPQPQSFVVDKLIPEGFVTLLVSAGGRGKTTLCLQAMVAVASGTDLLGFKTSKGAAFGMFCEDSDAELHRRILRTCDAQGVSFAAVAGSVSPVSFIGRDTLLWGEKQGASKVLEAIDRALSERPGLKLLAIDGVAQVFGASEIDRGQVTRFMAALNGIASRHGVAIVLISHESKSSEDTDTHAASGSTAWINSARSVLKLGLPEKAGKNAGRDMASPVRILKHIKANLGPKAAPIECSFADGTFRLTHSANAQRAECRRLVRDHLPVLLAGEARYSLHVQARNSAAKALAALPEFFLLDKGEIQEALEALCGSIVEEVEYDNKGSKVKMLRMIADSLR